MEAIYRLAWLKDDSGLVPVKARYGEATGAASPRQRQRSKGHARKTSGSYYTPDSLVQALLDGALDPVLERVEAEADDPAASLLSVTVLDPACGSRSG
jgi:hypothetical protein